MTARRTPWQQAAHARWPRAPWILGDGPHAVLGCKQTVTLHTTADDARSAVEWINRTGCGGGCCRRHRIIDLKAAA